MLRFASASRTTALGSPASANDLDLLEDLPAIMMIPRSLSPRWSSVRSATVPCPTHAMKSWFITWVVMNAPVARIFDRRGTRRGCGLA